MKHKNSFLKVVICASCLLQIFVIPIPVQDQINKAINSVLTKPVYNIQEAEEGPATEDETRIEEDLELEEMFAPKHEQENEEAYQEEEEASSSKEERLPIYLTFDDGPSASTEELLDILKEYGAKATFFMLEPNIRKNPEMVARSFEEGHALGCHSVSHRVNVFYQSTDNMLWEMAVTSQAVEEIVGVGAPLVRVPYGSVPYMSNEQKEIFAEEGFNLWDWNVDSMDWRYKGEGYVNHTIEQIEALRSNNLNPVVLLHDLKTTVEYMPQLLEYLDEHGYECLPLNSEMAEVQFKSTY